MNKLKTKDIIRENKFFFTSVILLCIIILILSMALDKGSAVLYLASIRTPGLNDLFLIVTRFGEEHIFILAVALLSIFYTFRSALTFACTGIATLLISFLLKSLFRQPRPLRFFTELGINDQIGSIDAYEFHQALTSFPSGHSMGAFSFFTLIALLFPNKIIQFTALILAFSVALSRIYLGQHFMADVAVGALTGSLLASIIYYMFYKKPYKA